MYKTIIGFDIEDFSKDSEAILLQKKRSDLELLIKEAASTSGFGKNLSDIATLDTGDGVYIVLDSRDYANILTFFEHLKNFARKVNSIRFRGIIHAGDCSPTKSFLSSESSDKNIAGSGIIEASRYLDSDPLKELLKVELGENFVFGISNRIFYEIKDQSFFYKENFIEYAVVVKKFNNTIFLETNNKKLNNMNALNPCHSFCITKNFQGFLDSSMITDLHNSNSNVCLSDMFVFPEFLRDYPNKLGSETIKSDEYFKTYCDNPRNIIISGDEQIGKTSLCKMLFKMLYEKKNVIPIYICLSENYSGAIKNKINQAILEQYDLDIEKIENFKKLLIIDDFYLPEPRYQKKILEELSEEPNICVMLMVDSIFNVNFAEREIEYKYDSLSIKEFTPGLRYKLIEKWMESENIVDKNYINIDELRDYVSNVLLKGLVPSTPLNVLIFLEQKKLFNPIDNDITSKGHCYQALIYISLRKSNINDAEIDIYLSFLGNFAYFLFKSNRLNIDNNTFNSFYNDYLTEYNQPIKKELFLKNLINSRLLKNNSFEEYCFSSEYVYYYFVSKYLADHSSEKEVKKEIENIYNNLDKVSYGYLGVLIIHHLRNEAILEDIEINLLFQFDKYKHATMNDDEIEFLNKHIEHLTKLTMNTKNNSYDNRQKLLEDEAKVEEKEVESRKKEIEDEYQNNDFSVIEEMKKLRCALRTVEVMGHILKTRPSSIKRNLQKKYLIESLNVLFRITRRFLDDFRDNEDKFIEYFEDRIIYFNKDRLLSGETYDLAKRYFCQFNLLNYYACIYRSVSTLCSSQLIQIMGEVCDEINTTLSFFIKLQSNIWYTKKIDTEEIRKYSKSLKGIHHYLLTDLLIRYCEMHDVKFKDRQRLANILQIDLKRLNKDV
jgi:hypothetical protein